MLRFDSTAEVVHTLDVLAEREVVRRIERRPGQKEERYVQLLGATEEAPTSEPDPAPRPDFEERLSRLEAAVEDLRARLDA